MQHAGLAQAERGRMLAIARTNAAGLHAHKAHAFVRHEAGEDAHGIGTAAHAGQAEIGQASGGFQHLGAGFAGR